MKIQLLLLTLLHNLTANSQASAEIDLTTTTTPQLTNRTNSTCAPNKFLATNDKGFSRCEQCPPNNPSYVVSGQGDFCASSLICEAMQVKAEIKLDGFKGCRACEQCSLIYSSFVIAFQFFSFAMAAIYVERQSSNRANLLQLKVISNFCQVATLTTFIDIPLPGFLKLIPLNFPEGNIGCLIDALNIQWNADYTFYLFLYLPLFLFRKLKNANKMHQHGSAKFIELVQLQMILVLHCYTPVHSSSIEMISCFPKDVGFDRPPEWVLVKDPALACSPSYIDFGSLRRGVLVVHVLATGLFVGIGLPAYIMVKTADLKKKNDLSADNDLAILYEYYSPRFPGFESIVLLRKSALLLPTVSTWVKTPTMQSSFTMAINSIYAVIFFAVKPMVYHPTAAIKNRNLFDLTELAASIATITGNVVALLIAIEQDSAVATTDSCPNGSPRASESSNALGIVFAVVNILFVLFLIYAWDRDRKVKEEREKTSRVSPAHSGDSGNGGDTNNNERRRRFSLNTYLNSDLLTLETEWVSLIEAIQRFDRNETNHSNKKAQQRMKDDLPFSHSKLLSFVARALHDEPSLEAYDQYDLILQRVNADINTIGRSPVATAVYQTCLEICLKEQLYEGAKQLLENTSRNITYEELSKYSNNVAHYFECYCNIEYNFELPEGGKIANIFNVEGRGKLRRNQVDDFALVELVNVEVGFKKGLPWLVNDSPLDMSKWRGITLNDGGGRVTAIDWSHSGLRSCINPNIKYLTQLKSLNLTMNSLKGEIPAELGYLQNLEELRIAYNNIKGTSERSERVEWGVISTTNE